MSEVKAVVPSDKNHWLKMRQENLNSTEAACLFGLSPYQTEFELWHKKKGNLVDEIKPTERMSWGNRLESAIASGIAEDRGWKIQNKLEYMFLPSEKLGSSFDFEIEGGGLLEIKNVGSLAFKNGWALEDDSLQAPNHIELQVQHQLMISGQSVCFIGALVGGNESYVIEREADQDIQNQIKERAFKFWQSIQRDIPPKPDFNRDEAPLKYLHKNAIQGSVMQADVGLEFLVAQYKSLDDAAKKLEQQQSALKLEILSRIGHAEKVIGNGFSISAGIVQESEVSYTRKAYRNMKFNFKKG